MKKTIIHIEAGNDNWTPTTKELAALTRHLRRALKGTTPDDTAVFTTRDGVKVSVIEFDPVPYPYVTSGFAQVISNQSDLGTPSQTPGFQPYTITTTQTGPVV
jgi:hypothetical protein